MRKWMLISALLLASASAHAGPNQGLALAAADIPAATTIATDAPAATAPDTTQPTARPLPPVTQTDSAKDSAKDNVKDPAKPQIADAPKARASRLRSQGRRYESDEAKARRIAAKYGISW